MSEVFQTGKSPCYSPVTDYEATRMFPSLLCDSTSISPCKMAARTASFVSFVALETLFPGSSAPSGAVVHSEAPPSTANVLARKEIGVRRY